MTKDKTPDGPVGNESEGELPSAEDRTGAAEGPEHSDDAGASEEIGGPRGPEPTRYGDWERKGRCIDF